MELERNKAFDDYVEQYKKLSLSDKKKILEDEIKEIIGAFDKLINRYNVNPTILYNREILDLKKEVVTEDDFTEAMFVYINAIKELIGIYVEIVEQKREDL